MIEGQKIPEGAIITVEELNALLAAAPVMVYEVRSVGKEGFNIRKEHIIGWDESPKTVRTKSLRSNRHSTNIRYVYLRNVGKINPRHKNQFWFTNYWFAYAHLQRLRSQT